MGEGNIRKIAEPFIEVLKQIGCDGFLSYEICSPQYVKHALISLKKVDTKVREDLKCLKQLISKI